MASHLGMRSNSVGTQRQQQQEQSDLFSRYPTIESEISFYDNDDSNSHSGRDLYMNDNSQSSNYDYSDEADDYFVEEADLEEVPIEGAGGAGGSSSRKNTGPTLEDMKRTNIMLARRRHRLECRRRFCRGLLYSSLVSAVLCFVIAIIHRTTNNSDRKAARLIASLPSTSMRQVATFLHDNEISSVDDMTTQGTPQYLAVSWIAEHDEAAWPVPKVAPSIPPFPRISIAAQDDPAVQSYRFVARYIMAVLWMATTSSSPQPSSWKDTYGFTSQQDICQWNRQGDDSIVYGVTCDSSGLPIALILESNSLVGTLPSEIGQLTSLVQFDLTNNRLNGSMPTELCQLSDLELLALGFNQLTGKIPACTDGAWSRMENLFLSDNYLSGDVPSNMAAVTPIVARLALDDNHLSGDIQLFYAMSHLEQLFIESNTFYGVLNEMAFVNNRDLVVLDASNNDITSGTAYGIPLHLLDLQYLQVLDLSSNRLSGPMDKTTKANTQLRFFAAQNNALTGFIPNQLHQISNLEHFDLSDNLLHGPIHANLAGLTQLSYFFLANNPQLTAGTIPQAFAHLTNLRDFSLKKTNRHGPLPEFIGTWQELMLLDLDDNNFSGAIPTSYGNLQNLKFALFNENVNITGQLPTSFGGLSSLQVLLLDSTNVTGSVEFMCNLPGFNLESGTKKVITVSCSGANALAAGSNMTGGGVIGKLECSCCQCCLPGSNNCAKYQQVMNYDASWETSFARDEYNLANRTYV